MLLYKYLGREYNGLGDGYRRRLYEYMHKYGK